MTPTIVGAVKKYNLRSQDVTNTNNEPSLESPAIGRPISHGQIIDIYKSLSNVHSDIESPAEKPYHLDDLLRGAQIYVPPPKPTTQPTQEFKDLMARLRREEEARKYNAMLASSTGGNSSNPFAISSKPSSHSTFATGEDEEEMTFADVNRQITLIINVLVTIIACGIAIWLVASHISPPKRLALAMGGALLVAIAEVAIYAGYLRRITEAKTVEKGKKEKKTVIGTWTIGGSLSDKVVETTASGKKEDETNSVRYRAGKRR